uniref:Small ribosomal subunit protein uS7c n=1 Tax=Monomastix sp. (strain OKE-1) TaxID=141716 RepID=C0JWI6_MONSK|nr:ribosomal protein S7 [Monomastix sp. OKE-1]ACK36856.1 ribosomal protein S7 [Monomastix sp. OKE-1]
MSRRKTAKKRTITPDPIYRSRLVSMMVSRLLQDGKKSVASRLFYESLDQITSGLGKKPASGAVNTNAQNPKEAPAVTQTATDALKVFQQAVLHATPVVEVKSRRVGGSNYQVPLEVNSERGTALALRWLVQAARQRPGREMATKLAQEFLDASNKAGGAVRKREETHKMAEANKAFANYRF